MPLEAAHPPHPGDWMTLVEAARQAGLTPDTLRRQVLNGRLAARKRGRDWVVSHDALWTYLENRSRSMPSRSRILERQKDEDSGESKYRIRGHTPADREIELVAKPAPTRKMVITTVYAP